MNMSLMLPESCMTSYQFKFRMSVHLYMSNKFKTLYTTSVSFTLFYIK